MLHLLSSLDQCLIQSRGALLAACPRADQGRHAVDATAAVDSLVVSPTGLNLFGNMPVDDTPTTQAVDCVAEAFSGLAYTIEYTSPRFLLALVGAIVLIGGVWHADRSWDEKGSAAYNAAKAKTLLVLGADPLAEGAPPRAPT